MKIVHLLASPFDSGPAETVVQLALAQRALGHDVWVACDQKRTTAASEALLLPRLESLGLLLKWKAQLSVKAGPFQLARDAADIRNLQCDLVHCHFTHDHVVARLAARQKIVRSIHAPRSLTWSTPTADGWTVPMQSLLAPIDADHKMVLPALVDDTFVPAADRPALKALLKLPPGPLIGMVSTFQPSRRHSLGLQAFALLKKRHDSAHFALVGDGQLEPELRAQVETLQLNSAVTFAGYQSGAHFVQWLQACDEVWVLGLGNDFAARAAAQAQACGVRVVAVNEGALAQYADTVVTPDAESLVAAALKEKVSTVRPASIAAVAQQVIDLYAAVLR